MKVLQFAFDTREESDYLPHNYGYNSVVYTGTHDNHTAMGWFENVKKEDFYYAVKYLKLNYDEGLNWGFIRGAWSSVSYLAIAPMQDFWVWEMKRVLMCLLPLEATGTGGLKKKTLLMS